MPTRCDGSAAQIDQCVLNFPDFMVFDLDPYIYSGREARGAEPALNREAFARTREIALALKEILDGLGLPSFVKTTGRTGLHVFVPICRQFDYDTVRAATGRSTASCSSNTRAWSPWSGRSRAAAAKCSWTRIAMRAAKRSPPPTHLVPPRKLPFPCPCAGMS